MGAIQFVQTTPEEFKNEIVAEFESKIQSLEKKYQIKSDIDWIHRKEAAKHLKVSLVTLWNWTKDGKLKGYAIGSKVYYKRHELDEALIAL